MTRSILFLSCLLALCFPNWGHTNETGSSADRQGLIKELTRGLNDQDPIRLKALEIRPRIYEPRVIYVLDRSKVDVLYKEEDIQVLPRILKPIVEDTL